MKSFRQESAMRDEWLDMGRERSVMRVGEIRISRMGRRDNRRKANGRSNAGWWFDRVRTRPFTFGPVAASIYRFSLLWHGLSLRSAAEADPAPPPCAALAA
ncbi:MAG: hypothetical protein H0U67_04290 [Gemmatimonadetes bacterium]|nr:hypothetical protein [Gemmatimonadota bacterium]